MTIQTIAEYTIRPEGIEKVKQAIREFVPFVKGTWVQSWFGVRKGR